MSPRQAALPHTGGPRESMSFQAKPEEARLRLLSVEEAAGRAGLEIRYRNLSDEEMTISSGMCLLENRRLMIVDKRLSQREKAVVIAKALMDMDLETVYLPPATRDLIASLGK